MATLGTLISRKYFLWHLFIGAEQNLAVVLVTGE